MNPEARKVVLVQPSYLRLYGSHNNRVPLELHYLHRFLAESGYVSQVVNLDKTDASVSIPWSGLYENSHLIEGYLNNKSSILDESIERILSLNPDVVVLSGGESLTPWADLGNPYVAALLSRRLRTYRVRTIGVGPFFAKVPGRFSGDFDAIILNAASPSVCDVVDGGSGVLQGAPLQPHAIPLFDSLDDRDTANVVMTSVGCPYSCNFCLGASTGSIPLSLETVVSDIRSRPAGHIEIGDAVFALSESRLRALESAFVGLDREIACELSVGKCDRRRLERLASLGVVQVKVGIESGSDAQLIEMGKRQEVTGIERAVLDAKSVGMQVTGYVLLGGARARENALETLELCRRLPLDDVVVNVLSHFDLGTRDFSRDAHWSKELAEFWNVADVMPMFFGMQAGEKVGIGRLLEGAGVNDGS